MKLRSMRSGPSLNAPKQRRSADTLARIANAAEQLLQDRSFDDIAVVDIVKRARSSVGAFYARFADKDALLDYLDQTHAEALVSRIAEYSEDDRWQNESAEELVREIVGFLAGYFRDHHGVLRAVSLRARLRKDPLFQEARARLNRRLPELIRLVLSRRGEIAHPSPELAAYLGFVTVCSTLRERLLFPEAYPTELPLSDSLLADELAKAYVAYLGLTGTG